jgi:hypothetical protein
MIECNLCGMQFQDKCNPLLDAIKKVHERWHTKCKKEKRNTTEGTVKWKKL